MQQSPTGHVTLTGDVVGEYRIIERRPDGTLILEPETAARASLRRLGATPATKAEFDAFVADNALDASERADDVALATVLEGRKRELTDEQLVEFH